MRYRLLQARWWVLSLYTGVFFGLGTGLFYTFYPPIHPERYPGSGVLWGAAGGIIFGLLMGPILARQNERARALIGTLTPGQYGAVARAVSRGTAPADPVIRAAAARLAEFQLAQTLRFRTVGVILFGVILVSQVVLAVTSSAWHWVLAVLLGFLLAQQVWQPRRLRRRIELLRQEPVGA